MKLDFPNCTEIVGSVRIHGIQKIYELDSSPSRSHDSDGTIKGFDNTEISNILHEMAIVVPVKNEKLKLLEGVLSGIPNECLVIIVSNSKRIPIDRFEMEVDMIKQYSRFVNDKKIIIVHQQDPFLGSVLKKVGYTSILENNDHVRNGKAEGMIIGMILAKMYLKQYVGFIDSDNYIPGAVNEYVKIFAAGFGMSKTPYCNVRVSWSYKPKVRNNALLFAKYGRTSKITNEYLNNLISEITGFETEIIKTGNAGEHALSMPLAENLHYSSGYSIETHEFIDIFEKFGGLIPSQIKKGKKGVEIFQIETRNPHFHEDKGKEHLSLMLEESLLSIHSSKICPPSLSKKISDSLASLRNQKNRQNSLKEILKIEPISIIPIDKFVELITNSNTIVKCGIGSINHYSVDLSDLT